jgi:hypothetical protein
MNQLVCVTLLTGLYLSSTVGAATVSVASVVSNQSKVRLQGVAVLLAVSRDKGGVLADDTSTVSGIYNLSTVGVQDTVTGLWVICDDLRYAADPQWVPLTRESRGVRTAKPTDLIVEDLTARVMLDTNKATSLVGNIQNTAGAKMLAGLLTRPEAVREVRPRAEGVLRRVEGTTDEEGAIDPKSVVVLKIISDARRLLNPELLQEPLIDAETIHIKVSDSENASALARWLRDPAIPPTKDAMRQLAESKPEMIQTEWLLTPNCLMEIQHIVNTELIAHRTPVQIHIAPSHDPYAGQALTVKRGDKLEQGQVKEWLNGNAVARLFLCAKVAAKHQAFVPEWERIQNRLNEITVTIEPAR